MILSICVVRFWANVFSKDKNRIVTMTNDSYKMNYVLSRVVFITIYIIYLELNLYIFNLKPLKYNQVSLVLAHENYPSNCGSVDFRLANEKIFLRAFCCRCRSRRHKTAFVQVKIVSYWTNIVVFSIPWCTSFLWRHTAAAVHLIDYCLSFSLDCRSWKLVARFSARSCSFGSWRTHSTVISSLARIDTPSYRHWKGGLDNGYFLIACFFS